MIIMLWLDFWTFMTYFGEISFWLGAATISALMYRVVPKKSKRYLNWFIFATLPAITVSYFTVSVLKIIFAVPRPCIGIDCPTDYSFPSGHSAVIFSAVTMFTLFFHKKRNIHFVLITIALLTAYSRVVLGVHTLLDIIGGIFVGIAVAFLIYKNYKEIIKKIHEIKLEK